MNREQLKQQIEHISTAILHVGGEVDFDAFTEPASEKDIQAIEVQLGYTLPTSFRQTLLTISSHLFFFWQLPDEIEFDEPNHEIFSGHLEWNLQALPELKERNDEMIESIFNDETDAYDEIWKNKLPFLPIGNGDYLALDIQASQSDAPIVYLSHDGSDNHGLRLADNFTDLLVKWSQLGFVGAEDWQWEQFITSRTSGIDPNCHAALTLRNELNFDL